MKHRMWSRLAGTIMLASVAGLPTLAQNQPMMQKSSTDSMSMKTNDISNSEVYAAQKLADLNLSVNDLERTLPHIGMLLEEKRNWMVYSDMQKSAILSGDKSNTQDWTTMMSGVQGKMDTHWSDIAKAIGSDKAQTLRMLVESSYDDTAYRAAWNERNRRIDMAIATLDRYSAMRAAEASGQPRNNTPGQTPAASPDLVSPTNSAAAMPPVPDVPLPESKPTISLVSLKRMLKQQLYNQRVATGGSEWLSVKSLHTPNSDFDLPKINMSESESDAYLRMLEHEWR